MTGIKEKDKAQHGEINLVAACLLCVWFTVPVLSYYPSVFFAFAAVWLVTARGLTVYLYENAARFLLLAAFLAVAFLYVLYNPADYNFYGNLKVTLLGLFCVVFFDFYFTSGDFVTLRRLCFTSLTVFLSCSALSVFLLREDVKQIKRSMSEGVSTVVSLNFGTFYSALFILAGCFFLLVCGKGLARALGAAGIVICVLILLLGQFTLSILLAVLLLLTVFINKLFKPGLFGWSVIFLLSAVAFVLLLSEMSSILVWLSEHISISYVSERLLDMAGYITSGQAFHSSARIELYMMDLACIMQNPLTGVLTLKAGGMVPEALPGGHSSLLGLFANYGIFTSVMFCAFLVGVYKKVLNFYRGTAYYLFLCPICFIFVVLSAVNPTFNVQTLCFTMMVIIPSLPLLSPAAPPAIY